jgi:hypothetical protein
MGLERVRGYPPCPPFHSRAHSLALALSYRCVCGRTLSEHSFNAALGVVIGSFFPLRI